MRINICLSANSKYMRYLYITLLSIMENNRMHQLVFYIFQRDFTENDKAEVLDIVNSYSQRVCIIDVDGEKYRRLPEKDRYTLEAYFRFEILTSLPVDVDRAVYFDVDMIITGDLAELYSIEMDDYYFAACQDMMAETLLLRHQLLFKRTDDLRYFNSGMMLWNIKNLRGKVFFDDFMDAAEELGFDLPCVDQDILNYKFINKTKFLDSKKFNFMVSTYCRDGWNGEKNDALVLHFTGVNPWIVGPKAPLYKVWWSYAKKTPFYVELLEEQLKRTEEYIFENEKRRALIETDNNLSYSEQMRIMLMIKGHGFVKDVLTKGNFRYCIWGGGKLGQALAELICYEDAAELVAGIIDSHEISPIYEFHIYHDMTWMDDDCFYRIIITPYKKTEEIRQEIKKIGKKNIEVITLSDILREIMIKRDN